MPSNQNKDNLLYLYKNTTKNVPQSLLEDKADSHQEHEQEMNKLKLTESMY